MEKPRSTPPPRPRKEREGGPPEWARDASDEFRRFKDLSERLVRVPKKELDEKRKGEKS